MPSGVGACTMSVVLVCSAPTTAVSSRTRDVSEDIFDRVLPADRRLISNYVSPDCTLSRLPILFSLSSIFSSLDLSSLLTTPTPPCTPSYLAFSQPLLWHFMSQTALLHHIQMLMQPEATARTAVDKVCISDIHPYHLPSSLIGA